MPNNLITLLFKTNMGLLQMWISNKILGKLAFMCSALNRWTTVSSVGAFWFINPANVSWAQSWAVEIQGEAERYPLFWGLAVDLSRQRSREVIAGLQFRGGCSIECEGDMVWLQSLKYPEPQAWGSSFILQGEKRFSVGECHVSRI